MSGIKSVMVLLVVVSMVTAVFAEEKKWVEQAELSFVDTGGNTDVVSLSAKNLLKYTFSEKLKGAWKLSALYGESDGVKNAERYSTELRLDYLLTDQLFSALIAGWLEDEFAGIESRYYLGPAVGYEFFNGPRHFLVSEVGLNYVKEKYTDGTEQDYPEGRAFGQYQYAFTIRHDNKPVPSTLEETDTILSVTLVVNF
jgi:putative salt-induced outer membrane protein